VDLVAQGAVVFYLGSFAGAEGRRSFEIGMALRMGMLAWSFYCYALGDAMARELGMETYGIVFRWLGVELYGRIVLPCCAFDHAPSATSSTTAKSHIWY
jgi:hypothetical protein